MASDKQEILDAIAGVTADLDVLQVNVDALEKLVLEGKDTTAAFAEIKAALVATKAKSGAVAADSAPGTEDDAPPVEG